MPQVPLATSGLLSGWLGNKRRHAAKPYIAGRVLDFACGSGHLATICNPDSYFGYDVDPLKIAWAREHYPGYQFEAELPESARFDTVVALAFIEHVEPDPFLKQMSSMLDEHGRMVLTTPHPAFEWVHTLGARARLFSMDARDDHEALISASAMKQTAERNSLELTVSRRFLFGANQLFVLSMKR
jgi:2-polyprenyl-3-methyl-5-hydroxy-6-metoxy-1,4-benzoquinol methylase